jgi:hypothetical protein
MPRVGFEPTTPMFERAKRFHASDRAAYLYYNALKHCFKILHSYGIVIEGDRVGTSRLPLSRVRPTLPPGRVNDLREALRRTPCTYTETE